MLSSVRVVDATTGIAGGYCAKLLGDAGAEVVKAESPDGDPLRGWSCSGRVPDGEDGALFRYLHHGHRSAVVSPTGVDAEGLVGGADVVLVDRDGVAGDPADLAGRHPELVVVAISPYGLDGPYAARAASELTIQADSGGLALRGRINRPPVQAGGQVTDWVTGVYAAVAALAALRRARRSGRGELIDVSWCEVANLTCANFGDLYDSLRGRPDLSDAPAYRSWETPSVEPTKDGYVGFNTNTRQQFDDFLSLIERPDLLEEPAWALLPTRQQRWDDWNAIVHEWTMAHETAEIVEKAALLRIPVAPVSDPPAVLRLEQAEARGVFVDDPTGSFRLPRRPWKIDGEPPPPPSPAPRLGEHTAGPWRERSREGDPPPPTLAGDPGLPLDGVRVVDLTAWWAGPSATGILGALGADVVHVESITRPDGMRMAGGMFYDQPQWWERSAFFLQANTNKRGITLDLASTAGRELLLRLVGRGRPRHGELHAEGPRVLRSRLGRRPSGQSAGRHGAHARLRPGRPLAGPARLCPDDGAGHGTGLADRRARRSAADPARAVRPQRRHARRPGRSGRPRAARRHRSRVPRRGADVRGGPGDRRRAGARVVGLRPLPRCATATGAPAPRPRASTPAGAWSSWLALSVLDDGQWRALVDAARSPTVGPRPRTCDRRRAPGSPRRDRRAPVSRGRPPATSTRRWTRSCEPACRRLARWTSDGRPSNPQFVARGYCEAVDHPVVGTHPTPTVPFRFSGVDRWVRRPAPTLGQHNREVLGGCLGCADDELGSLAEAQVIGDWPVGL